MSSDMDAAVILAGVLDRIDARFAAMDAGADPADDPAYIVLGRAYVHLAEAEKLLIEASR